MEKLLRLGRVDEDINYSPEERRAFLELYHHRYIQREGREKFRDDIRGRWYDWEPIPGQRVRALTQQLQAAGFMPHAEHGGVYGYATQAAVRLFQEYVRTIGDPERHARRDPPSWPDGVVGDDTRYYLERWAETGQRCRWARNEESADYRRWINWLNAATRHYREQPTPAMQELAGRSHRGDSLLPEEWSFDTDEPHLIGIRRRRAAATGDRPNDDLFVLLIQGLSFYFWGSTDPRKTDGSNLSVIAGQHLYRFNWHKLQESQVDRLHKGARPAGEGVMTQTEGGALAEPKKTFNIHWSGVGGNNWSAGCQVISGRSYLNDEGERIDCGEFAAVKYADRGTVGPAGARLTMGAYCVLSDLLFCYTRPPVPGEKPTFRYTLFEENSFAAVPGIPVDEIGERLRRLCD
ncbi:peptidoglycan-binding domain-containing protein [Lewinella sp. IMCC34183]|uniref:peptidoglycan-binding domain-containing protein n=1 Tax=Lewinella sp. IMCC34183 TaxID=2248762 RepID=UPI000E263CD3|nr:peptidoglycan-binding protein [Lewinella sp. IMCC34183]